MYIEALKHADAVAWQVCGEGPRRPPERRVLVTDLYKIHFLKEKLKCQTTKITWEW